MLRFPFLKSAAVNLIVPMALLSAASFTKAQQPSPLFGAYMQQTIYAVHSPAAFGSALSNGFFDIEFGWIEPLGLPLAAGMDRTFIRASFSAAASPFSSSYAGEFSWKIINWLEFRGGYHRFFLPLLPYFL